MPDQEPIATHDVVSTDATDHGEAFRELLPMDQAVKIIVIALLALVALSCSVQQPEAKGGAIPSAPIRYHGK